MATLDRTKQQVKERRKLYLRDNVSTPAKRLTDDKKLRRVLVTTSKASEKAIERAMRAEMMLASQPGFIEPENSMEKTYKVKQAEIVKSVDVQTAHKKFSLKLNSYGPYNVALSHNGRHMLLAGNKGHVASMDWVAHTLSSEIFLKETVRDVTYLHNESMYACAQRKYAYIYDSNTGAEIHCMRNHFEPTRLQFLKYHFLLASVNTGGILRYHDTSTGEHVSEINTHKGACHVMAVSPYNAIVTLGHSNGTVSLWTPNTHKALVKMLCHAGSLTDVAVHSNGVHMVTSGLDGRIKVWDVRKYATLHTYLPSVPTHSLAISQRGVLAWTEARKVLLFKDALNSFQTHPYLTHESESTVERVAFVPYEDVLVVGHALGIESMLVPGAGEPNFDTREANPYQTARQRSEHEVHTLLEKLPPDTICIDPREIGSIRQPARETNIRKRALQKDANAPRRKLVIQGKHRLTRTLKRNAARVEKKRRRFAKFRQRKEGPNAVLQKQYTTPSTGKTTALDSAISQFF
eukprot:c7408_g1_i1.p1 GENE.c7408_g1_i1~~c7408_g1_i1.p1  ORF type:complete len:539 (-),score=140.12 c7408_g1_i1:247-1803(-)